MAIRRVSHVGLLVRDQDDALRWYTEKLGFEKREDNSETIPGFRWLTVGPKDQKDLQIVLLKAQNDADLRRVGAGTMWVLETDDCQQTYEQLRARGVKFSSPPEQVPWGISAVFEDLYGNPFNLVQPRQA